MNHVGVGAESQAFRFRSEHCSVMLLLQFRMGEQGQEHLPDQLVHQLAPAPVGQQHPGIVADWDRTDRPAGNIVWVVLAHRSSSMLR